MKKTILLLIILFACLGYSQTYKKIKIQYDSPQDISRLAAAGIDLEGIHSKTDKTITIFADSLELTRISSLGIKYSVLIDDWNSYYKEQLKQSKNRFGVSGFVPNGSMGGHFTYNELKAQLDTLKVKYPGLISSRIQIGKSVQNRSVFVVKISSSPDNDNGKPEVLYTALIHAREPGGMMTILYYMYYLLENYNSNSSVKYLVDNRQIYFMPCINPDGYVYNESTNPQGGGMWRKNMRLNDDNSRGVDLNRNFGPFIYWDSQLAPDGSSNDPSWETFRGLNPFSEPETKAYCDFVSSHNFKAVLNYHTFGNYLVTPYGAKITETPDSLIFREYASKISGWNKYDWGTDMQTVGYSTRGDADDFMYDGDTTGNREKSISMTPEVGSEGFWALPGNIIPYGQLNLNPNIFITKAAGEYLVLSDPNFAQKYFNPGSLISLVPVYKNSGLSTGKNIAVHLKAVNNNSVLVNPVAFIDSIESRKYSPVNAELTFRIDSNVAAGTKLYFEIAAETDSVVTTVDTISINVTVPSAVADNDKKLNYSLGQNYPNPFNPSTVIKYSLEKSGYVTIKLFNMLGEESAVLLNEYRAAGNHELYVSLNTIRSSLSSGVYFYTIRAGDFIQTRKMVILK